ncbi:MAG: response regulator [Roseburia sp.]
MMESGKKSILVVDDSALALRSMKTMLSEKYRVTIATSAKRGMEAIRNKRPDLILLDYDMPECDGREMLKMIRQDKEIADIPVIFLTAVADKEHIMAVLQLNPNGYFRKPLERNMVMKAIAKVLGENPDESD